VFWQGSPRQVAPGAAAGIGRALPSVIARVGVFVDFPPAGVARIVRAARLDAVQLHGDEDPDAYLTCGAAVIKAVSLTTRADVQRARAFRPDVLVLVDARDPVRRGGSGRVADWSLAVSLAKRRPILLAGGISAANVRAALRAVHPWGIDVSSGVESRPGVKSAAKIEALFSAVSRADREEA
jgi:phosphoribosylanthranilate isomerase